MSVSPSPVPSPTRLWVRPIGEEVDVLLELGARLTKARRRTIRRHLHRAVFAANLRLGPGPSPLYYKGSLAGRRYTPVGGPAGLYLSFDNATPIAELRKLMFEHGLPRSTAHNPITIVAVDSSVGGIIDLTDEPTRRLLDVTDEELDEDWERKQEAHTRGAGQRPFGQLLTLAAHATKEIAGVIYQSRRADFGTNVVIFPDRLYDDEFLQVLDDTGVYAERIVGTARRPAPRG